MSGRLKRYLPSPAMIVATVALLVALGGTSGAAVSVTGPLRRQAWKGRQARPHPTFAARGDHEARRARAALPVLQAPPVPLDLQAQPGPQARQQRRSGRRSIPPARSCATKARRPL